jgi:hypothetical protein
MKKEIIMFKIGKKTVKFTLEHNSEDLNIPLNSWLNRTENYTVNNFIKYVKSKDSSVIIKRA